MEAPNQAIYLGIRGTVVALDRSSGGELWRVALGGSGFVNLTLDGDRLLATAKGEIFCLDAATGEQLWQNKLPGMGTGLMSVVTAASPASSIAVDAAEEQQRAAAAAVAT